MAEKTAIQQAVEKAVSEALESHVPQLREQLVHQLLEQVQPHVAGSTGASQTGAAELLKALNAIQAGTTQKEILRALLESMGQYSGRAALFVMKSGSATGWQGRAFDNNEDIKDFALDVSCAGPAQVLQARTAIVVNTSEMDSRFISQFGAPVEDRVMLLPLHLKDKVAALVYADAGTDSSPRLDTAALELLVTATSAWLEVASLRKQAAKEGSEAAAEAVPVQTVTSYSDPFAAHAPKHAAVESVPAAEADAAAAVASSPIVATGAAAAAAAPAPDAFAEMSVEDAETHRKAQRFARLLVDEVKLYNQAKVTEGRKNKDLYDRLKEDIEKSRSTYLKRYGNTAAASADYFNAEVIRSLAEDDASLLGANFAR